MGKTVITPSNPLVGSEPDTGLVSGENTPSAVRFLDFSRFSESRRL